MTCAKQTVRAVIVSTDGGRWEGTNARLFPQNRCPREGMPSGVGYELCRDVCGQAGHAEVRALEAAGSGARGATLTLVGHSYVCGGCLRVMRERGVASYKIGEDGEEVLL